MNNNQISDRQHLARLILTCHCILIAALILLFISNSLLTEEFTPLLTLLLPVTSLYAGSVFKYIGKSIRKNLTTLDEPNLPHFNLIKSLIILHFMSMFFLIISKSVFNWIEYSMMITLMTFVESTFGGYLGSLSNEVFSEN